MRPRSLLAIALLGALALLVPVTGASAHAEWLESVPAAGSTVDAAPSEVRVSFDSQLLESGAALVVTNADDVVISVPTPVIDRADISVAVDPGAPPGVYTVAFRVASDDGHTVSDTFTYTVADPASTMSTAPSAAASSAPSAAAVSAGSGGVPAWVWIIGAVALIAVVVAVAVSRRRT